MSNNIRIRKNKLKGTGILAAAALTAALIAGNNIPGVTRQVSAAESQENTVSSLIPDNITLDKPVELADVELPATEYGTFEWADGSFVPAQRVQSCEVLLIPAEGQDLSHVDGWDPESGAVVGYINVIVNSITDSDNVDKTEGSGKTDPTENADPTETPETSSEKPAADENADTDNKEDKESKSDQDNKTDTDNEENKIEEDKTDNKNNKESIDNVWDITKLQEYGNELDENINKQIVSLNAMIAAERDKKDTDWDKINEWQEQIEDLRDTLADSANDMIAELGGVGSDENFKTLAENFASAWLEAFQETGDGLSGLQESFDDFMENYVKQQILLRLSDKFLKPMFEEFDSLIATRTDMEQEDQERYFELQAQITKLRNTANNSVVKSVAKKANAAADEIENSEEYKRLQKAYTDFLKPNDINTEAIKDWSDKMKEVFGEYNEAAEEIFNQIGWEPGGKANLSALTQSIQGITETTAEALEALLNSIRFFVNQQTTDITAIRNLLEARYSLESQAETNPLNLNLVRIHGLFYLK